MTAEKHIVIVTDIFGRTEYVEQFAADIAQDGVTVEIISAYQHEALDRANESEMYERFIRLCGHEKYLQKVFQSLKSKRTHSVIGFSAGASAAWRALSEYRSVSLRHLIVFYPGRIRKHLHLIPQVPTTLIFPNFERDFDIDQVLTHLVKVDNLFCLKTDLGHGFMNPLSENYDDMGYKIYTDLIADPKSLVNPEIFRKNLVSAHTLR